MERWRINGFNLIFTIFTCYSIKKKNLNMGPTDYIYKKNGLLIFNCLNVNVFSYDDEHYLIHF